MISTKPYKNYLADHRKNKGLTQSQLGEKIGVAYNTISRYENGDRAMDKDVIVKVAEVLQVEPHELFTSPTEE